MTSGTVGHDPALMDHDLDLSDGNLPCHFAVLSAGECWFNL